RPQTSATEASVEASTAFFGHGSARMSADQTGIAVCPRRTGLIRVDPRQSVAKTEAAPAETKNPAGAGSFCSGLRLRSGGLERLDAGGQAALVAGGLVPVDQAARAEAVQQRLGHGECGFGAGGVVGVEGLEDLLDGGAQLRTLGRVARVAHDGLLGALLGGLDVGHDRILETGMEVNGESRLGPGFGKTEPEIMGDSVIWVNRAGAREGRA